VPPLGLLLALALATLLSVASTARAGEVTPGCVEDPATEHVTLHSDIAPQLGAQYIAALVDPGAALAAPRSWASRPAPDTLTHRCAVTPGLSLCDRPHAGGRPASGRRRRRTRS
jgi:hypothetical protein